MAKTLKQRSGADISTFQSEETVSSFQTVNHRRPRVNEKAMIPRCFALLLLDRSSIANGVLPIPSLLPSLPAITPPSPTRTRAAST